MKKYIYMSLVAIAALCGCTREESLIEGTDAGDRITEFYATMDNETATRTTIDEDYKQEWVKWDSSTQTGDQISVNGTVFNAKSSGPESAFVDASGIGLSSGENKAYYPKELCPEEGKTILPATYTYEEGKFNMPMYAESTTNKLIFHNLCGVLAVTVPSGTTSVTLMSENQLNGYFSVDADNDYKLTFDYSLKTASQQSITVDYPSKTSAQTVYIPVPAGNYERLVLECGIGRMTVKKTVTIERNKIYSLTFSDNRSSTHRGLAEANVDGFMKYVEWVQLWAGGPKFATRNVGATADDALESTRGTEMTYFDAVKTGSDYVWGANWKTPSKDEMDLLDSDKVTCTFTTQDGTPGFLFTGVQKDYTDDSLFLPALTSGNQGDPDDRYEYYWTSTPCESGGAWSLHVTHYNDKIQSLWLEISKYNSVYVRPVLAEEAETEDSNLLPGVFSVSATKKVQFTRSNLYWNGTAFKFEANQTDYPASWDASHVGHFFWTNLTDFQSGTESYMPYAASYTYGSLSASDKCWCGVDNPLTVEGTSGLYALSGSSSEEWYYLFTGRENCTSLFKYEVTVTNGDEVSTNCLIIAPDDYSETLKSSYTLEEVNAAGLVCLPEAGYRDGTSILSGGTNGYYTSTTHIQDGSYDTYCLSFRSGILCMAGYYRNRGMSVRLVHDIQ